MIVRHVHWAALPVTGGVETHLHALVAAQREAGLDSALIAGTADAVAADFNPLLEPGGGGGPADLARLTAAAGADVLHLHNPQWHRPEVVLDLLAALGGAGWDGVCVLDVHNLADRPDHWALLAGSGHQLVAHSAFAAEQLTRLGRPVTVLPLALPADRPGGADPIEEAGGPPREPGLPVLLQPTRLSAWKGSQHSLAAVLDLLDAGRDLIFAHAGVQRLVWDPGLPEGLLERAEPWRRRGRVRLVHYPPERSWQAIRSADLVLHPTTGRDTRGEPYSLSVAQAVVLGRPVLATSSGNLPDLLHDHAPARTVPPDDPVALAAAIGDFLDGRWPRADPRAGAARRVSAWHAGVEAAHRDLYRTLLGARAARRG